MAHVNKREFSGVLGVVDQPSDKPPAGARGHNIRLRKTAVEESLHSLIGMAISFDNRLDRHDVRRKVGVITSAELSGNEIRIAGYLFARDFPEVIKHIEASADDLGMSYEASDCRVADIGQKVWEVTNLTFCGIALLKKSKAAYQSTSIRLSAGSQDHE